MKLCCTMLCLFMLPAIAGCNTKQEEASTEPNTTEATITMPETTTESAATEATEEESTAKAGLGSRLLERVLDILFPPPEWPSKDPNEAAPIIVEAIETRDIATLEAMMCQNIKDNIEDLPGEIARFIDAIEGRILETEWETVGGYDSQRKGKRLQHKIIGIFITTDMGTYQMGISWETWNNFAPEEMGIRTISLDSPGKKILSEIRAPESDGGGWHD